MVCVGRTYASFYDTSVLESARMPLQQVNMSNLVQFAKADLTEEKLITR